MFYDKNEKKNLTISITKGDEIEIRRKIFKSGLSINELVEYFFHCIQLSNENALSILNSAIERKEKILTLDITSQKNLSSEQLYILLEKESPVLNKE